MPRAILTLNIIIYDADTDLSGLERPENTTGIEAGNSMLPRSLPDIGC